MSSNPCHRYNESDTKFWPLDVHTAASLGDVPFFAKYDVRNLKADTSAPNCSSWTPLMYACARGHSLLVNYLLLSGAEKNCKSISGVTPLMLAITSGDLSTVETVFDFSSMEYTDYRKWTPLFYAVHFTREKCLKYLLTRGANVNIVDFQNETPLMVAIKTGRESMVELILQYTTNLNVTSFKHESALMLANESSSLKIKLMVREKYEYLKTIKEENESRKLSPRVLSTPNDPKQPTHEGILLKTPKALPEPMQHCSPTPLKQQLGFDIRKGRSLTFSPNNALKAQSPGQTGPANYPWKMAISKKLWSPQLKRYSDVQQFLKRLGLEKYWTIFRDEEVDFETLLTLNEDNLQELGITLFGPRKKIYLAIQQLRNKY